MELENARLGYREDDLRRIGDLAGKPLDGPSAIRDVLDRIAYLDDWRHDYRIQSVRSSLHAAKITCIDAAILSYGLLELLFGHVKRRLLAIHRRDPRGEECGHCVTLYWGPDGRVGAFSKSSFPGLAHQDPVHNDETSVATSYARAYVAMGFQPLYFGVTTLEEVADGMDWRHGSAPLNVLSGRIQERYQYSFELGR